MKISKIRNIKNLRNIIDFNSDITFDKNTIIYAPNGSGKTNISRLFSCISNKSDVQFLLSQEQPNATVSFLIEIGTSNFINEENFKDLDNTILVFNTDFVEKNIKCNDFSEKDVSGNIQIAIGDLTDQIIKSENTIKSIKNDTKRFFEELKSNFDIFSSNYLEKYNKQQKNIWTEFVLDKIITSSKENNITLLDWSYLEEVELQKSFIDCETKFSKLYSLSNESILNFDQEMISFLKIESLDNFLKNGYIFLELNTEIETKLKKITSEWIKDSLSQETKVSTFVKNGIEVSESDNFKKCIFCYRNLDKASSDLFSEYKNYFKNEKGVFEDLSIELKNSLNDLKKKVLSVTDSFENSFNEYSMLFNLKDTNSTEIIEWKKINTGDLVSNIEVLINKIDEKTKDPSENVLIKSDELSILKNQLLDINNKISFNKKYTDEINKKIKNNETQRTELRTIIGKKLLHDFIKLNNDKLSNIKIKLDELNTAQVLLSELQKEASTDVAPKIVDLFNFFLNERVGIKKYKADFIDKKMVISLNNIDISKQTNKISEGEKNIIGLCYFLASSIQKIPTVDSYMNSVFIIDDPISSTSYSNFFGITSVLHKFEIDIKEKIWSNFNNSDIHVQKIILTHNVQFLNMLSMHVFRKGQFLFLNPQTINEIKKESLLSEFEISLLRLYQKKQNVLNENIGNDLRKIFETLRHFYGFDDFNAEAVKKIFDLSDDDSYRELYSVSNYYSHANIESSSDPLPPDVLDKAVDQFIEVITKENSKFVDLWNKTQKLVNM